MRIILFGELFDGCQQLISRSVRSEAAGLLMSLHRCERRVK
jgi:hypothetical protein